MSSCYPAGRNRQPYDHLELTSLPRLPIPPLSATAERVRRYLAPLLHSTEEEKRLEEMLAEYLVAGGEGEALDHELHQLAKVPGVCSRRRRC